MSDRHPLIYNEFDIEAARKAGKSFEQERIIKLLEVDGFNCDCDWCQINGDMPSQHHWRILALIKGKK